MKNYDYIFVGTGSSLLIISKLLLKKKKIAVIEKSDFGGTCLNRGCIPSKMLIHSGNIFKSCSEVSNFHINLKNLKVDFSSLVQEVNRQVHKESLLIKEFYENSSVDIYHNEAKFVKKNFIQVGSDIIQGKKIVLNIGAVPSIPKIKGLEKTPYITSNEALKLKKLPKKLAIIGGGYIGLEMAYYFSCFGSKVQIFESKSILLQEDWDIVKEFKKGFKKHADIKEKVLIKNVKYHNNKFIMDYFLNKKYHQSIFDNLLVCTGRKPNLKKLQLEKTDIKINKKGFIIVDKHLKTTQKNVWALGDCIHSFQLKHLANYEAKFLIDQFLHNKKSFIFYPIIPYAIFSYPEIATAGKTEKFLEQEKINYFVKKASYSEIGKGWIMKERIGFIKLIFSKKNQQLLGCTIIGKEAAELIHILSICITKQITLLEIKNVLFIHPTLSEIISFAIND